MAVYQFSALSDGQAITFNPSADVLNFDQTSIAAADVRALAEGSNLRMSALGKDVVLLNVTALQIASTNVTFADGSRLLFGDNSTGQSADNSGNSLLGTSGADHLWGLGGSDTLNGGAGDDWLVGGTGQDAMTGGTGADRFAFVDVAFNTNYDRIFGFVSDSDGIWLHTDAFPALGALGDFSAGDARFHAAAGAVRGHDADDRIIYNTSNGTLYYDADGSGAGRELFIGVLHGAPTLRASDITVFDDASEPPPDTGAGTNGNDTLVGTAGDDTIDGLAGNDSIAGLGGNDSLIGGAGADTLNGGSGDDTFVVDASDVLVDSGGIDTVASAVTWTLTDGFENLTLTGNGVANAIGNNQANWLVGNDAANGFSGRAGDDTMTGNGGDDIFVMSTGGMPGYGSDFIDGGAGVDTLDFGAHGTSALVVDLAAGSASGGDDAGTGRATLVSIENVNGGAFADVISGDDDANFLFGYLGDDMLDGGAGNDRLEGAAGADRYLFSVAPGTANSDIVVGFVSGSDAISLDRAQFTNVGATNFAAGDARFSAGPGFAGGQDPSDRIIYNTSNGNLYYDGDGSGTGAALLIATLEGAPALAATDIDLEGASPVGQVINGTAGNDSLVGGSGSDTISAFPGDDTLNGGLGNDVLRGGDGRDTYVLAQPPGPGDADEIQGYEGGWDAIRLDAAVMPALGPSGRFSALDVRYHAAAGASSGADADDRIVYDTAGGNLYYDPDGSGTAAAQLIAWIQPGPFAPRFVQASDLVVVNGSASGLVINGTSGNDYQTGTAGPDTMNGFGGNDTLFGYEGNDRVDGGEGNDELHGNEDEDVLLGGAGNDSLSGEAGNDTMLGGDGDDVFWLGFFDGHDSIDGGAGADLLDFNRFRDESGATVDLAAGTSSGGGVGGSGSAALASIENVTGTRLDDRITGNAVGNALAGSFGNDTIDGGGGDDVVDGASGNDVLSGGDGNDTLSGGEGNDSLQGGLGADLLQGGGGGDSLTGGAGADTLVFDTPPSGGVDVVSGFVSGMDQLRFDGAVFTRIGASGAFSAADGRFHAAPGATGGHDADDRIVYDSISGDLYYDADGSGSSAAQLVARLQGAPTLAAGDIAVVNGSVVDGGTSGNDSLVGSPADDTMDGAGGNDTLDGQAGNDRLVGGPGNDSLIGNEGADMMVGGDGNDSLDGAAGADGWWFGGEETFDPETGEPLPGDTMDGGLGDDVYYVQSNDSIADAGGIDTIHTDQTTYTLGAGFENLDYMPFGFSDGEGYFITYSGNELDNQITVSGLWHSSTSVLDGGDGNDTLVGDGRAVFKFSLGSGDYGHDHVTGEGFTGTIDLADARSAIVADLAAGTLVGGGAGGAGSATLVRIDNAIGGAFNDRLIANPTGDDYFDYAYLRGGGGSDTLEGAAGNSYYLFGEDGSDRLVARGTDFLAGDAGADDFVFARAPGGAAASVVDFASGTDRIVLDAAYMPALGPSGEFAPNDVRFHAAAGASSGHDADDRVVYDTSSGNLWYDADGSGAGAAQLITILQPGATLAATDIAVENGTEPPPNTGERIVGTSGSDALVGTEGDDTLEGLGGSDTLNGAGGDDWLEGGTGQDALTGGTGADSFVFRDTPFNTNYDRIFNFASGTDELVFDRDAYTNIGALGDFAAGDGRFFAAAGAVRGHDADDRIIYNTSNGTLYYDADGSGAGREMYIGVLHGAPTLDATDIAII